MASMMFLLLTLQSAVPVDQFRAIQAFRCDFTDAEGRTYPQNGSGPVQREADSLNDLIFEGLDYRAGRARVGTAATGAVDVTLVLGERATSFLGLSVDRNPMLTTIFQSPRPRDEKPSDTYFAVMSRHTAMAIGHSDASQLYGTCRAVR